MDKVYLLYIFFITKLRNKITYKHSKIKLKKQKWTIDLFNNNIHLFTLLIDLN